MAKESFRVRTEIVGAKQTLRAISRLGKDANKAARESATDIARLMAGYIKTAGAIRPDQRDKNIAATVRVSRDRLPAVDIGGRVNPKVSGGGTPANLVIGMEFGAKRPGPNAWRFPPRTPPLGRGNRGYWIYPTARRNQDEIVGLWYAAMDTILRDFGD